MRRRSVCASLLLLITVASGSVASSREITFEERIAAQTAIERVYWAHRVWPAENHGPKPTFEQAVPRELIEQKVTRYLEESAALDRFWRTPVTSRMLGAEAARIARETRMPERLAEIRASLGDDPFLFEECVGRPILVDRLIRNFFAFDPEIHGESRNAMERIRAELESEGPARMATDSRWEYVHVVQVESSKDSASGGPPRTDGPRVLELDPESFARYRARFPRHVAKITAVREERDRFTLEMLIGEESGGMTIGRIERAKRGWDDWWQTARAGLSWRAVAAVSSGHEIPDVSADSGRRDLWRPLRFDEIPDSRDNHTAVWTGTEMLIWGGFVGSTGTITGGRYDPATDRWTPMSTLSVPSGRGQHTAVWTGSEMIVWGGTPNRYITDVLGDGSAYNPVNDSWRSLRNYASAPAPRVNHTAVWSGSLMLVYGGYGANHAGPGTGVIFNDGGRYDPATDSWSPIPGQGGPSARHLHSAVWTGTEMLVWGGVVPIGSDAGGRYDPVLNQWRPITTAGEPELRYGAAALWTGTRMLIWGGATQVDTYPSEGGAYDPSTDRWSPMSTMSEPSGRFRPAAVWTGSRAVFWGGASADSVENTGGVYDPSTDQWQATTLLGAPASRAGHTGIWTGDLMIVWGGGLNSGGRYDPVADVWTPTSVGGPPSARARHTAIWTGSRMIVWGGGEWALGTGSSYDPVTATWTEVSSLGAPSPREGHTAIWTGRRMIVWGGEFTGVTSEFHPLDTGAQYDPVSDTWQPTAANGAPEARSRHTAVWTGSRMIVWGGLGCGFMACSLATGAQYDPAADAWTPVATAGAPSGRYLHSATWTGSRMVVWGGKPADSGTPLDTGARYDPTADSWSPVSSVTAPAPRYAMSALWTGREVLIWGGYPDALHYPVGTGARYDPSTDRWSPITTQGAPSVRVNQSAIWTGAEVIVWGGSTDYWTPLVLNDGARYSPSLDQWTAMTSDDAPSARQGHTAVWTETEMIIWGGSNALSFLNSGRIYGFAHSWGSFAERPRATRREPPWRNHP